MNESLDCLNQLAKSSFSSYNPTAIKTSTVGNVHDILEQFYIAGFKAGFVLASCDPAMSVLPVSPIGEKP